MRMVNLFLLKSLEIFSNILIDRASGITQTKIKSFSSFNYPEIYALSEFTSIKLQRKENYKNLIIRHLNINSVRNKLEMIAEIIKNFDIFLISDSKSYSTFPNTQFKNTGCKYLHMTEQIWWRVTSKCE